MSAFCLIQLSVWTLTALKKGSLNIKHVNTQVLSVWGIAIIIVFFRAIDPLGMVGIVPPHVNFALLFLSCSCLYNALYLVMNSFMGILIQLGHDTEEFGLLAKPLLVITNVKFISDISCAIVILSTRGIEWIIITVYYFVGVIAFSFIVYALFRMVYMLRGEIAHLNVSKNSNRATTTSTINFSQAEGRIRISTLMIALALAPATPVLVYSLFEWIYYRFDFVTVTYPENMTLLRGLVLDIMLIADLLTHAGFYILYMRGRMGVQTPTSVRIGQTLFMRLVFLNRLGDQSRWNFDSRRASSSVSRSKGPKNPNQELAALPH